MRPHSLPAYRLKSDRSLKGQIFAVQTESQIGRTESRYEDPPGYARAVNSSSSAVLPRLKHAMISTLTARRGTDGHAIFSFPALVAPYAGTMTAVYGWYPRRYDAEDGFRMGNYTLLGYVAGNLALEFLYGGPHSLLSRMYLKDDRGATNSGSNP